METGRFETNPESNAERAEKARNLEKLGEELSEKLLAEMDPEFGRQFEAPKKIDDEDEKSRRAEITAEAEELQRQIDETTENIAKDAQVLATLPLTPEQQSLLTLINQLIAQRENSSSAAQRVVIDDQIEQTTKQLAALPVTDEQGALLDDILRLMDEREKTEIRLREIYRK